MTYVAQDTFTAELDGGPLLVTKGSAWPDKHPVVKLDAGRDLLFKPLDMGDESPKAKLPSRAAKGS